MEIVLVMFLMYVMLLCKLPCFFNDVCGVLCGYDI